MQDSSSAEEKRALVEILKEMRIAVLRTLDTIVKRTNDAEVHEAMKKYDSLVDQFYQDNENFMVPGQYKAAKQQPEYFIILLDLAIAPDGGDDPLDGLGPFPAVLDDLEALILTDGVLGVGLTEKKLTDFIRTCAP